MFTNDDFDWGKENGVAEYYDKDMALAPVYDVVPLNGDKEEKVVGVAGEHNASSNHVRVQGRPAGKMVSSISWNTAVNEMVDHFHFNEEPDFTVPEFDEEFDSLKNAYLSGTANKKAEKVVAEMSDLLAFDYDIRPNPDFVMEDYTMVKFYDYYFAIWDKLFGVEVVIARATDKDYWRAHRFQRENGFKKNFILLYDRKTPTALSVEDWSSAKTKFKITRRYMDQSPHAKYEKVYYSYNLHSHGKRNDLNSEKYWIEHNCKNVVGYFPVPHEGGLLNMWIMTEKALLKPDDDYVALHLQQGKRSLFVSYIVPYTTLLNLFPHFTLIDIGSIYSGEDLASFRCSNRLFEFSVDGYMHENSLIEAYEGEVQATEIDDMFMESLIDDKITLNYVPLYNNEYLQYVGDLSLGFETNELLETNYQVLIKEGVMYVRNLFLNNERWAHYHLQFKSKLFNSNAFDGLYFGCYSIVRQKVLLVDCYFSNKNIAFIERLKKMRQLEESVKKNVFFNNLFSFANWKFCTEHFNDSAKYVYMQRLNDMGVHIRKEKDLTFWSSSTIRIFGKGVHFMLTKGDIICMLDNVFLGQPTPPCVIESNVPSDSVWSMDYTKEGGLEDRGQVFGMVVPQSLNSVKSIIEGIQKEKEYSVGVLNELIDEYNIQLHAAQAKIDLTGQLNIEFFKRNGSWSYADSKLIMESYPRIINISHITELEMHHTLLLRQNMVKREMLLPAGRSTKWEKESMVCYNSAEYAVKLKKSLACDEFNFKDPILYTDYSLWKFHGYEGKYVGVRRGIRKNH